MNVSSADIITEPNSPTMLNLKCCMLREVPVLYVRASLRASTPGCDFCHQVLNHTMDACRFLKASKSVGFIGNVFQVLKRYGKIPTGCPVKKVKWLKILKTIFHLVF